MSELGERMPRLERWPQAFWILIFILLVGGGLRFYQLGARSMSADHLAFITYCQKTKSATEIFSKWEQLQVYGHLPFAPAATKWVIEVLDLKLSHFSVRLSSAFWGFLAIPAAFLLGVIARDRRLGLLLAALIALFPFHIDLSRVSYFYAPLVTGAFLHLAAVLYFLTHIQEITYRNARFHVLNLSGFFLLTYAAPAGWSFAGLTSICLLFGAAYQAIRLKRFGMLLALVGSYLVVLYPLVVSSWGWNMIAKGSSDSVRAYNKKIFAVAQSDFWWSMKNLVTGFSWGNTPVRSVFSVVVLGLGLGAVFKTWRKQWYYMLIPFLFLSNTLIVWYGRGASGHTFAQRYLYAAFPAYLLLLGIGLTQGPDIVKHFLPDKSRMVSLLRIALVSAAIALFIEPAYLANRYIGLYKTIVHWADSHFPPGTPVVCDRFFTAWNEFPSNNPTNVFYMSTVPNQLLEEYRRNEWRKRTTAFLLQNPDAALFEQKMHWTTLGPWRWPHHHFSHKKHFLDQIDIRLKSLGLREISPKWRPDLGPTIYYNTPEDLMKKGRQEGKKAVILFGEGWQYIKTRDGRDWRMMGQQATLKLHGLEPTETIAKVEIRGVAVNGSKKIVCDSGQDNYFPQNQIINWTLNDVALSPGQTELILTDPFWINGGPPLLVEILQVE